MSSLESLVVDLQVNSAALRSGLDAAKGMLSGFGESVKGIDEKLHHLSEAKGFEIAKEVVKGLAEFVQKGAEAAEKMGMLAQASGVTVETFSKLDYAAGLSGVSTEDLGKAFTKLNVNLAKAGAGGHEQVALFSALGVSVKDAGGHVRDSAAVMGDLAERFSGLKDGASKSALAVDIFGKTGAGLIPMLNEGKEGIEKFGAEADRFGITVTTGAAASAKEFEDDLKKLQRATQAVGVKVAAELTPVLSVLTEQLLGSKEGADLLKGAAEVLANVLKGLISAGVIVGAVFEAVGTNIAHVASAIVSAANGDFAAAGAEFKAQFAELPDIASKALDRLKMVWTEGTGAAEALKKQDVAVKRSADSIVSSLERQKKALAEAAEATKSLTKFALDQEAKVAGFGAGPIEEMAAKLEHGELSEQLKKIGSAADDMKARILGAVSALADLEMARMQMQSEFKLNEIKVSVTQSVQERTNAYNNGGNTFAATEDAKKGFQSFQAALDVYAEQTVQAARDQQSANMLRKDGDEKSALEAEKSAAQSQRMADLASHAADAFQAGSQEFINAISAAAKTVLSKMGDVGQIVGSAMQGFMSGGPWGAIIAVIGELLSRLQGFTKISEMLNNKLFDSLGELNTALAPLFELFTEFSNMLNPIRQIIHSVIEFVITLLGPVFKILGALFEGIGKILAPIATALGAVFEAIGSVTEALNNMEPVTVSLGITFKLIGAALSFAMLGIMGIALGVVRAVQEIMKAVGANTDGIKKTGDDIEAKGNAMATSLKNFDLFKDPQSGSATAGPAKESTAPPPSGIAWETTDVQKVSVVNFNEMLTNLPGGYKYKGAQFRADDGGGAFAGMGGTASTSSSSGSGAPVTGSSSGPGVDEAQAALDAAQHDYNEAVGAMNGNGSSTPAIDSALALAKSNLEHAQEQAARDAAEQGQTDVSSGSSSSALTGESTRPGAGSTVVMNFYGSLLPRGGYKEFVEDMSAAAHAVAAKKVRNAYPAKTIK